MTKRNILWCVSGSIAVYKTLEIISELTQEGYNVRVVMSRHACEFVQPLTFEAISKNKVHTDLFCDPMVHIRLADESDLCVIAPASYNCIGKLAHGIADDLVTTLVAATGCPKILVPAMNSVMYEDPVCQANLVLLRSYRYHLLEPEYGSLACGHVGFGRFPNKERIRTLIEHYSSHPQQTPTLLAKYFHNKRVLLAYGGTREALDPVRYIGNYSSGKMGRAMTYALMNASANVKLVCAHTEVLPPEGPEITEVTSALEMLEELKNRIHWADILIMVAAVSDYSPKVYSPHKIKKNRTDMNLELIKNPDILESLAHIKQKHQIFVGFAAESDISFETVREKLERKRLDLIVINDIAQKGIGFGADHNEVRLMFADGRLQVVQRMHKYNISVKILEELGKCFYA